MHNQQTELAAVVIRGAEVAYYLDNPPAFGRSFKQWLSASRMVTQATGRSEIVSHLQALCGRAVARESRGSFDELPMADQLAVCAAHAVFRSVAELEHMSVLGAD